MILETERLILRPWTDKDAEKLYKYAKDPEVGPTAGWPVHTSIENSLEIIHNVLSKPETYAVVLRESEEVVGSVGIMFNCNAPTKENEAEIGYWIGKPFWGQGLIPEAVRRLLKRCFEELDCVGVWCAYYDGNKKSKRVQEKCGFSYHHTDKDKPCKLMEDVRTEHFSYISKSRWEKISKTVVLYRSKYGYTKKYAEQISKELGCDLKEIRDFDFNDEYATLIFGGGLYAGKVNGLGILKKKPEQN